MAPRADAEAVARDVAARVEAAGFGVTGFAKATASNGPEVWGIGTYADEIRRSGGAVYRLDIARGGGKIANGRSGIVVFPDHDALTAWLPLYENECAVALLGDAWALTLPDGDGASDDSLILAPKLARAMHVPTTADQAFTAVAKLRAAGFDVTALRKPYGTEDPGTETVQNYQFTVAATRRQPTAGRYSLAVYPDEESHQRLNDRMATESANDHSVYVVGDVWTFFLGDDNDENGAANVRAAPAIAHALGGRAVLPS